MLTEKKYQITRLYLLITAGIGDTWYVVYFISNFDYFPLPLPSNLTLWRARRKQRGWGGWRSSNALCCFNNSEWHSSGSCFIIL